MNGYRFTTVIAIGIGGNTAISISSRELAHPKFDYLGNIRSEAEDDVENWIDAILAGDQDGELLKGIYRAEVEVLHFCDEDGNDYKLLSLTPIDCGLGGDL
jgi:hypothetical protein